MVHILVEPHRYLERAPCLFGFKVGAVTQQRHCPNGQTSLEEDVGRVRSPPRREKLLDARNSLLARRKGQARRSSAAASTGDGVLPGQRSRCRAAPPELSLLSPHLASSDGLHCRWRGPTREMAECKSAGLPRRNSPAQTWPSGESGWPNQGLALQSVDYLCGAVDWFKP